MALQKLGGGGLSAESLEVRAAALRSKQATGGFRGQDLGSRVLNIDLRIVFRVQGLG